MVIRQGNIRDEKSIRAAVKGSDIVVNAVGILYPSGKQTLRRCIRWRQKISLKRAAAEGVSQLLHISALGVDKAQKSNYARTKLAGRTSGISSISNGHDFAPECGVGAEDKFPQSVCADGATQPCIAHSLVAGKQNFNLCL